MGVLCSPGISVQPKQVHVCNEPQMYQASTESVVDHLEWTRVDRRQSPQWEPPQTRPSSPALGSTTGILSNNLETKSTDLLCQTLEVLQNLAAREQMFFPNQRSLTCSLLNWVLSSCPIRSLCEQKPLSESQTAELSFALKLNPCSPFWSHE